MRYESGADINKFKIICKKCSSENVRMFELDCDNRFIKIICDECELEDYIKLK